ncbi:MAG: transglutaminase domain-containing protein [Ruminococcus sp.]|uniref:transglutaminase-like domain-containing protein n=1 Tax=Ruminococcus sp. TaxID=41978 RepID=UPI0025D01A90|nr:transglutaminase-like domain-containing protein [Ruminococcus sp.]MBO4867699.1 transglutaminase domain-containing protein [Ruminococcus sp.]
MSNKTKSEAGLIGSGGICIDGDIDMRLTQFHSSGLFFAFRIIIALMATFSAALLGNNFCDADISPLLLAYNSTVAVLAFGLLASKHKIIKICAAIVGVMYIVPLIGKISIIKYGALAAAHGYLTKGELPGQATSAYKDYFTTQAAVDQGLYYFFSAVILLVAIGTVIACVVRIDFPMLFIVTFPIVEVGLYLGFDVPTPAVLMMLISWITVLSMNIINHTTNKAGRNNTFAVHEKSKTFFFTSAESKAGFYTVYIKFVALVTATVFLAIVVFSKISGFYRPDSFADLRYNLHHAAEKFDITHADDFLIDVNGGSNLFGVTTVGGTNGGILGTTNGISFNGSKAMIINTQRFNYTMYLRGYVAGEYAENQWQPLETDSTIKKISDDISENGRWIQDYDSLLLSDSDEETGSSDAAMDITIKGACSKFVYAPYGCDYSYSYASLPNESGMTPYNDSYVRISQSSKNYTMYYKTFETPSWITRTSNLIYADLDHFSQKFTPSTDLYKEYVKRSYTTPVKLDSLDAVYKEICEKYLRDEPESCSYDKIYSAIKNYFSDNKFTYDTNPGKTPEGEDFLDYFLTKQKKGYCTYYATAGVHLLRMFGYPARYIEGYMILPSQLDTAVKDVNRYELVVKDKCAHAWTEVFIEGAGWMPAEFTPGYDGDNPNLTKEEKGGNKRDESSISNSSSNPDSSKTDINNSSKKPLNNSKVSTNSKTGSKTDSKNSNGKPGGGTVGKKSSNKNSDTSGNDSNNSSQPESGGIVRSPVGKTIGMTLLAIVAGLAAIIINRKRCLDKMHDSCTQKDLAKRVTAFYTYSLKYLSVLHIEVKKNLSDMQMCDELINKCHEHRIHQLDDKLTELTIMAVEANMSADSITEEEAARAEEIMRCISEDIVAKKLDIISKISARFIYCLY